MIQATASTFDSRFALFVLAAHALFAPIGVIECARYCVCLLVLVFFFSFLSWGRRALCGKLAKGRKCAYEGMIYFQLPTLSLMAQCLDNATTWNTIAGVL